MKKFLGSIAALLLFTIPLSAQTGPWSGKLSIQGTSLTIVFNFNEDGCTMDSPDQGAKGIKAEKSYSPAGMLEIKIPSIGASFTGLLQGNNIPGTFRQGGLTLPLTLKPGGVKLNRPQTPAGPFPYNTEEVSFRNGTAVLKGTLVTPEACTKNTAAVLLVTGSGLQNRDEEVFGHKPFAVIADALAKAGIASLRYDDRGFGESTGDIVNHTTEDLKNDAASGIALLRERFGKVGVIGHSEGGSIAFMLAAEENVDFVVSLAGAITPMKETLIQQNDYVLRSAGFPDDVVKEYVSAISSAFDAIVNGEKPGDISYYDLPASLKQNYKAAVAQCQTPYMRYTLALDIRRCLGKVRCPVIALNGTLDSQVECKSNLGALRDGLDPKLTSIVEVNGVNHLFQHCQTGSPDEYKEIEETISPEVLKIIADWINSTKCVCNE